MESQSIAIGAAGSILAAAAFARSLITTIFPRNLHILLSAHNTILIHQSDSNASDNHLFLSCKTYLSSIISSSAAPRFLASKHRDNPSIALSLLDGQQLFDVFGGIEFSWRVLRRNSHRTVKVNGRPKQVPCVVRYLELGFHKKHTNAAAGPYLRHIIEQSERLRAADRRLKLRTNCCCFWLAQASELHHPATFETLAIETSLKQRVMEDLSRFAESRDLYQGRGEPWKRSYLICGPSGTGKTSLISAMAKHLHLDIYDLNVKEIHFNSGMKYLLLGASNRSMLVVEDVDSLVESGKGDDDDFSIAGLLRFLDGMWTSTGEERVVVFTAREKGRVNSTLLEPGRVDMWVQMGFCGSSGLRVMARNYYGVEEHRRFEEIEGLMREVEVTPAEVGEELMRSEDVDVAMDGLVEFLHRKRGGGRGSGWRRGVAGSDYEPV